VTDARVPGLFDADRADDGRGAPPEALEVP
jgi:hypothetical protein